MEVARRIARWTLVAFRRFPSLKTRPIRPGTIAGGTRNRERHPRSGMRLTLNSGSRFRLRLVRISQVAAQAGVAASTVRYYERLGLMPPPSRTTSGYRAYDDEAAARLRFIIRAKEIGLTLEQIAELLPIWDDVNCAVTHEEMTRLVDQKRAEIGQRIDDLHRFAGQLDDVRAALAASPPPSACRPDLSCCMPTTGGASAAPIVAFPPRRRPASSTTPRQT